MSRSVRPARPGSRDEYLAAGALYVGAPAAESTWWRYGVLTPDGRFERGEAESREDAWLDARQVLMNARGGHRR